MTGNQLKILALVTMTIDHVGVVLLPQYLVLRIIGRLTYPIFAYMIAEGCFYTHSKRRYLGVIFALGLACQLGFFIAMGSLEQSILTTFVFAIITIYALQLADARRDAVGALAVFGAARPRRLRSLVLPVFLAGTDFSVDYGFAGVLAPRVLLHAAHFLQKRTRQHAPEAHARVCRGGNGLRLHSDERLDGWHTVVLPLRRHSSGLL